MALNVSSEGLRKLETLVKGYLVTHIKDREGAIEEQMLKNLRQYRAKYDPEVAKAIPEERSHAYPRDTRVKVTGFVAKLMEMMFPSQEENWELKITDVPSIPEEDLQIIIQSLEIQEAQQAEAEQRQPTPVTSDQIERRVVAFAEARKDNMESEIADQLDDEDTDYPNLCKRVLRSGGIYGIGVARSPMVRKLEERRWVLNEQTGQYEAKKQKLNRPYPEYVRIWDIYPDFSAHVWSGQDRIFERMLMGRVEFTKLKERPDFDSEAINEYLVNNREGNYTEASYETSIRSITNESSLSNKSSRRYEAFRMLGMVDAHDLVEAGVEVEESQMGDLILADIWIIDNTIIKAEVSAFGDRASDQYPAFIPSEDEDSGLFGVGLPEDLRDSQMGICASTRMTYDNQAASAGPVLEVNTELLANGRKDIGPVHAFMTIEREGVGDEANYPAVRAINIPSHIEENLAVLAMSRKQLDVESNLPSFLFGDTENVGEAFRTSQNMSMMRGGANMISKDTVRAFDQFTTQLIGGMLKWNMEFNDRPDIKGDFSVRAKGNISLVAKEVQGAALDQLVSTLTPEERAMVDTYGLLQDRFKSRDLPVDRIYPREKAEENVTQMQQAAAQANQTEQALTEAKTGKTQAETGKVAVETENMAKSADAIIAETISQVEKNLATAKSTADKSSLEHLQTLLQGAKATSQEVASE